MRVAILLSGMSDPESTPPDSSDLPDAESSAPAATGDPATDLTEDSVRLALRRVKDPELNLNIMDLGLVYSVSVDDDNKVVVDMSLTSPGCPAGPQILGDVERAIQAMPGAGKVVINLVWEPYWTPERIEPKVRAYLGL